MYMTVKLIKLITKYRKLEDKLNSELKKEYQPILNQAVVNKDESTLRELLIDIPDSISFKMRIYQGLVEIKQ